MTRVRVLYVDIDGTMVGPHGNLFATSDGASTLAAARALVLARDHDLEVVLCSGRSQLHMNEMGRLLGLRSWFCELGAVRIYEGGTRTVVTSEVDLDDLTNVMHVLIERFHPALEEHAPWNFGREHSLMVRGAIDLDDAKQWLVQHGYDGEHKPALEIIENGMISSPAHTIAGHDLVHVYHLAPAGLSKRAAIAADRSERGIERSECAMVGDARSDLECHVEVGTCFIMRNGVERDAPLAASVEQARRTGADIRVTTKGHTEGFAETVELLVG